jgi:hypothetical protein
LKPIKPLVAGSQVACPRCGRPIKVSGPFTAAGAPSLQPANREAEAVEAFLQEMRATPSQAENEYEVVDEDVVTDCEVEEEERCEAVGDEVEPSSKPLKQAVAEAAPVHRSPTRKPLTPGPTGKALATGRLVWAGVLGGTLILVVTAGIVLFGGSVPVPPAIQTAVQTRPEVKPALSLWHPYRAPDDSFTLETPSQPIVKAGNPMLIESRHGRLVCSLIQVNVGTVPAEQHQAILDKFLGKYGSAVKSREPIQLVGGYPGVEAVIELEAPVPTIMLCRVFVVKSRVYELFAAMQKKDFKDMNEMRRYIESFQVLQGPIE